MRCDFDNVGSGPDSAAYNSAEPCQIRSATEVMERNHPGDSAAARLLQQSGHGRRRAELDIESIRPQQKLIKQIPPSDGAEPSDAAFRTVSGSDQDRHGDSGNCPCNGMDALSKRIQAQLNEADLPPIQTGRLPQTARSMDGGDHRSGRARRIFFRTHAGNLHILQFRCASAMRNWLRQQPAA
jgi:hypothetical protein